MLVRCEWGEDTHSGGGGPLIGVQIAFSLCSVFFCLLARQRWPQDGVQWHLGQSRLQW